MKIQTSFLALIVSVIAVAQMPSPPPGCPQGPPPPHKRMHGKHPLLFALESDEFTQQERERLKKLAAENPRQFNKEMREHFMQMRKARAQKMLNLRNAYLQAKTKEEKDAALKNIRDFVREDTIRHENFQKRMLEENEKAILMMQKRLAKMKAEFEKRMKEREKFVNQKVQNLISDKMPQELLRGTSKRIPSSAPENKRP